MSNAPTNDEPLFAVITMDHFEEGLEANLSERAEAILVKADISVDDLVQAHLERIQEAEADLIDMDLRHMITASKLAGATVAANIKPYEPHIILIWEQGEIGRYWNFEEEPPHQSLYFTRSQTESCRKRKEVAADMSDRAGDGPPVHPITLDHILPGLTAYVTQRAEDILLSKGVSLDDVVREHTHLCRVKDYPDMLGGYAIAGPTVLKAQSNLDDPHIVTVWEQGEMGKHYNWGKDAPFYGERHPAQIMHSDYFVHR